MNKDLSDSIPSEFSKTRVYEGRDYYFQLDPMIRLRDITIHHPQEEDVYYVSGKVRKENEVKEARVAVDNLGKWQDFFTAIFGNPKVVVSVPIRLEYKSENGEVTVNFDQVEKLGKWTEVEVCVANREDIAEALKTVRKIFKVLGYKGEVESKTYPELLEDQSYGT
ncbi:hypothetical protein AKJ66_01505 [candidate division MSBL1 archaeon SCGC-AAA259E22]|uniref:CYTH domain-containing protein n=1 Tax=candidate division MSBL1 archaeon SCGC-AAA259E22 TaxID=1698265 RepID=A0A133UHQ7_9EURY|nr:hypothetical protein AKJ66_01505 [candidate division MSBL1 archaeon SCGC-AAA259E22]